MAIRASYEKGVTDEFVEPITIVDEREQPIGLVQDDDSIIMYNYRADRAREITMAFTDPALERPARSLVPKNLTYTMMTQYDRSFGLPFVLPPEHPDNILAEVMERAQWKNLRVAETEKYAHVTYFFNGGNERPYGGEDRELVASPKVATYDLLPQMSAAGITGKGCGSNRKRGFRCHCDELRECGHGGPFGQTGADNRCMRNCRCWPRRNLFCPETFRR